MRDISWLKNPDPGSGPNNIFVVLKLESMDRGAKSARSTFSIFPVKLISPTLKNHNPRRPSTCHFPTVDPSLTNGPDRPSKHHADNHIHRREHLKSNSSQSFPTPAVSYINTSSHFHPPFTYYNFQKYSSANSVSKCLGAAKEARVWERAEQNVTVRC